MFIKNKKVSKKVIFLSIIFLIVLILFLLEITNTTHIFHKAKFAKAGETHAITASASTKGSSDSAFSNAKGGPAANSAKNSPSPSSDTTLLEPNGTFVSNHRPNLSGSPRPNDMQSSCVTTPGVSCRITFTNGAIVKSLPTRTTDAGGGAYWQWKLQDIGLTAGVWRVDAIASSGSQTKSVSDTIELVVSP